MLDILRILHVYPHFSGWEVNFLLKDKALQRQSNAQCFQDIRRVDAKVVWCLIRINYARRDVKLPSR